jgi:GAF domain-containing protein
VINGRKSGGSGQWTQEEIALMQTLAEQSALALESARLYQDTRRRAARERMVGEVTGRIRETLSVEAVLKTAVDEIRQALQLERLVVRLGAPGEDAVRRNEKGHQDVEQD